MKTLFKIILMIVLAVILIIGGLAGYLTLTEYKPSQVTQLQIRGVRGNDLDLGEEFSITSFNIGYAALDKDTDFFMDGGTMSRGISEGQVKNNMENVVNFLTEQNSDFYLIQEVDEKATRSYGINQREELAKAFPQHNSSFAINYKVRWVPVPFREPMGQVLSGLLTLSKFAIEESTRHTLPGQYPWPTRLAQLDRCLLENRIPLANGQELIIAHIHLSAFDEGGFIRNEQLMFLENYALREFEQGNYVIIGGDWNHLLAKKPEEVRARQAGNWPPWLQLLPKNFLPEFQWAFDESVPSVRSMDKPYVPGQSFVTTIDGFLLSPNLELINIQNHDLKFMFSDHNPVTITVQIPQPIGDEDTKDGEEESEFQEEVDIDKKTFAD